MYGAIFNQIISIKLLTDGLVLFGVNSVVVCCGSGVGILGGVSSLFLPLSFTCSSKLISSRAFRSVSVSKVVAV